MIELLNKFCGKEAPFSRPWTFGEWSYATTGQIIIRIPKVDGVRVGEPFDNASCVPWGEIVAGGSWIKIPEFELPKKVGCDVCKGYGKVEFCEECDGCGDVHLKNEFNHYTCTCKTCKGAGLVSGSGEECEYCGGAGWEYETDVSAVDVGDPEFYLNGVLLDKIKDLPDVMISNRQVKKGFFHIKFNGGVGFVMGVYK